MRVFRKPRGTASAVLPALLVASALLAGVAGPRSARGQTLTQNFDTWPATTVFGTYTNADWVLSDGQVRSALNPWGPPYSSPRAAWLQRFSASTNAWLRTPLLSNGVGSLSCEARSAADGVASAFNVETSADGTNWTTAAAFSHSQAAWAKFEQVMNIRTPVYARIRKTADAGASTNLGLDDVTVTAPPDVVLSNLHHLPASPTVADPAQVEVDVQALPAVTNLALTALYRFGASGPFSSIGMALQTGITYRTATPIPGGRAGVVQYYVQCTSSGQPSPLFAPPDGSNAPAQYTALNPYDTRMRQRAEQPAVGAHHLGDALVGRVRARVSASAGRRRGAVRGRTRAAARLRYRARRGAVRSLVAGSAGRVPAGARAGSMPLSVHLRASGANHMRLAPIERPGSLRLRIAYWLSRRQLGGVMSPLKVIYARAPHLTGTRMSIYRAMRKLSLDPALRRWSRSSRRC